ncbi:tetraacyldisaccharide 4'-kinase [Avibacterium sp. 21-594]|uniref:tetraacyldisaccharide 4'-kinase n=1 Tax=Avibacterium sp. 21-594 TaxID=2911535 RepID=UPI0022467E19|nr:tetraacyldisaccharide 4'-kinase [Avibacterium sp. 21-594]MCW9716649.1 tetraacyldisaccharide 4'-kinase [Avibacterium sp. 21-594]
MNLWYQSNLLAKALKWLLSPFALLFLLITRLRAWLYQRGILASYKAPVPVVIVGNLSVGGNGKTPVVIWLVQQLQQRGIQVGVISRGYGSKAKSYPRLVASHDDPVETGDEPLLIAKRTNAPVCISPNRQQAIEHLLAHFPCQVIISDDGLQYYKLQRDKEIVVLDAQRQFGNGFVLPAGPLREPICRLKSVDWIINNGAETPFSQTVMTLTPQVAIHLQTGEKRPLQDFAQQNITAIAGIGNPQRFFSMLQKLAINVVESQAFQDHQAYELALFEKFDKNQPLFMTEKDAVKCQDFAQPNWWYVPVEAEINDEQSEQFIAALIQQVKTAPKSTAL